MNEIDIPETWAESKLEKIVTIQSGGTPKGLPLESTGNDISFVKVGDMNNSSDGKYIDDVSLKFSRETVERFKIKLLPKGTIIFPKRGGAILTNKKRILSEDSACDTNIMGLIVPDDLREFVWTWFKTIKLGDLHTGSTIPQVNNGDINPLSIPLPPLGEQKRIIQKIETCLEKIEETECNLKEAESLLTKYRESLLGKAFRGELIPQNLTDEPATVLFDNIREQLHERNLINKRQEKKIIEIKKDELFDIPKNWKWVRLGEISSKIVDGAHHTPEYTEEGINFISVKDIRNHKMNFNNTKYISEESHAELTGRCNPEVGDVLITKSGTIGRTCVVKDCRPFSLFVSVALVKVMSEYMCSEYIEKILWYSVNSHFSSQFIKGSAIKNLHLQELVNIPIALAPLNEQKRIVKLVNSIIDRVDYIDQDINKMKKLLCLQRESIFSKAFQGELVEQIEIEGTGSDLLGKVLALQELEKNKKKTTKEKSTKKKITKKVSKKKKTKK
jgi:type I restriction enzyme, S subunit